MTQAITENLNSMMRYRGRIFLTLVSGIIVFTVFYVTLVHSAIVNVVEREKIMSEIRNKSTEVSELESKYFTSKDRVNIALARAKGFQDSEVTSFISSKSLTAFVSHNDL